MLPQNYFNGPTKLFSVDLYLPKFLDKPQNHSFLHVNLRSKFYLFYSFTSDDGKLINTGTLSF